MLDFDKKFFDEWDELIDGISAEMYFEDLKQVLEEDFFVADEITPESRFIEDLGLDSLLVMQLLLQMEEKYGITIDGEEIEGIETIGDAVKLLEGKIG